LSLSAGFAAAEVTVSWSGKANAGISSSTTAGSDAVDAVAGAITAAEVTAIGTAHADAIAGAGTAAVADADVTGAELEALRAAVTAQATAVAALQETLDSTAAAGQDTTAAAAALAAGQAVLALNQAKVAAANGTAAQAAVAASTSSVASSGIDLNFSASVTTDSGITITVADDFGGGSLIDWNDDNAVEAQTSDLDQPAVTVAMAGVTVTIDPGQVSDLYDDSQTGDVQISTSMAGFSIDYVASQDTDANTNSYKLGYAMGDLSLSVIGTTRGDAADPTADEGFQAAENDAMKWSASYKMGDITLGLAMNNNGDNDDVTTGSVSYEMGNGLSVSLSADDNDDWDASATWTSGGMSVTYSTDEASDWSAYGSYALGNGASLFASTAAANDWSAFGVEFTF
jgi:hypothetical protein